MEHINGYILYNLNNEMYLGRYVFSGDETHRWVKKEALCLCENALDMLFNINSYIPSSRFPNLKGVEFKHHVKQIRIESKQILSFLKKSGEVDEIMVIPIDVGEDEHSYDIDFTKAFKLDADVV